MQPPLKSGGRQGAPLNGAEQRALLRDVSAFCDDVRHCAICSEPAAGLMQINSVPWGWLFLFALCSAHLHLPAEHVATLYAKRVEDLAAGKVPL